MQKFFYTGANNQYKIAAYAWLPETELKGLIYFAHGVTEYAERHTELFEMLAKNGYAVFANDHMGHGNSKGKYPMYFSGKPGISGWDCAALDVYNCIYHGRKKFNISRDIPLYGMGFSLGSFLVRTVAIRNPDLFNGLILVGTGYQNGIKTFLGKWMAYKECCDFGEVNTTPQISKLTFETYNQHFAKKTRADWLCSNEIALKEYLNDEKCGKDFTAGLFYDLLFGMEYTGNQKNIKQMNEGMPILLLSGTHDPVGDFMKGVLTLHKKFLIAGMNSTCISYDHMRHDILHEKNHQNIYNDILYFIHKQEKARAERAAACSI